MLDILKETVKTIRKIQAPDVDANEKDWSVYFLTEYFDYGKQVGVTQEDAGKAILHIVSAFIEEMDAQAQSWLADILIAAAENNDVHTYIDFEALVKLLPRSSHKASEIIDVLGYSQNKDYFVILEQYIDQEPMATFDAMYQILWDVSDQSSEVQKLMHKEEIRHVEHLLLNWRERTTSEAELQERYNILRDEVMQNMRIWFKQHDEAI